MMTSVLGLSAFYHDSAAALVVDGEIVAAAQEERFSRKKHDAGFPQQALDYCLETAKLSPGDLDYVAFYDKSLLKFERLLEMYLAEAPFGFRSFLTIIPDWLQEKLYVPREIRKGLQRKFRRRIIFPEHHESHAASAFFPSPFDEAAILTVDGVGEWATAVIGSGRGNRLQLSHELRFPHSPGMLYSAFTYYCGFRVNSGEYKLMGLAPYGDPQFASLIRERLIDLKDDGSFRLDMSYFHFTRGLTMTNGKFHALFGRPPRRPEAQLTQHDMDVAASVQVVMEEIVLRMAARAQVVTGAKSLCMAGGVALNCVANGRLLREGPFDDIWIQPAAGDAGGALGAALFLWHHLLGNPREEQTSDRQHGSFLGPEYTDGTIETTLRNLGAVYERIDDDSELCERVAALIASEHVVGWFQGRMEFGPRALGGRSILGDARSTAMQSVMNLKIKFRESFRPFAPAVLEDHASEYFDFPEGQSSPYMLMVAPVHEQQRQPVLDDGTSAEARGLDKLKRVRSSVPAITHVDYSARLQTVDSERHGRFHALLKAFYEQTGAPLVVNTSFNVRGEPIVCTPEQAYRCFMATNMDALVLEHCLLVKSAQPEATEHPVDEYLAQFQLD